VKWLLDTHVVSETARLRPNASVIGWIAKQSAEDVAISVVTVAELRVGLAARIEVDRRREILRWIEATTGDWPPERCLALTGDILIDWLTLARQLSTKGITRQAPDLLIAATARIHSLTIVTRNVRDFADTGIVVYDPWNDKTHAMDAP
jgi:toxin FitB